MFYAYNNNNDKKKLITERNTLFSLTAGKKKKFSGPFQSGNVHY